MSFAIGLPVYFKENKVTHESRLYKHMKWQDYLDRRVLYRKAWDAMKKEFNGDMREFLNSVCLVIAYGTNMVSQMDYKIADIYSIAVDNPDFFVKDDVGNRLTRLARQHKVAKDSILTLRSEDMRKLTAQSISRLTRRLETFDTQCLNVVENQVEVRFPTLKMDFIQQIKKSKYCDKELTDMSRGSIRVVLKI